MITSDEFKKDNQLVKAWREMRENEVLKMVMEIAASEGPLSEKPTDSDTGALVHYGRVLECAAFQKRLENLAEYSEVKPHPRRNYARRSADVSSGTVN